MYLTSTGGSSPFGLGQPASKPYKPPYDKGGIPIGEGDAQAADHPGRTFSVSGLHLQAMAIQGATPPRNFFRIVTNVRSQVPAPLQHLFKASGGKMVAGTIDRWTRMIYMIEAPGLRNRTRLEYALHEGVHLFADPVVPAGSCPRVCVGTFQRTYGTASAKAARRRSPKRSWASKESRRYYRDRPYEEFTKPVRKLIEKFSVDSSLAPISRSDPGVHGGDGIALGARVDAVAGYTTRGSHKKALAEIEKLETAQFQPAAETGTQRGLSHALRAIREWPDAACESNARMSSVPSHSHLRSRRGLPRSAAESALCRRLSCGRGRRDGACRARKASPQENTGCILIGIPRLLSMERRWTMVAQQRQPGATAPVRRPGGRQHDFDWNGAVRVRDQGTRLLHAVAAHRKWQRKLWTTIRKGVKLCEHGDHMGGDIAEGYA